MREIKFRAWDGRTMQDVDGINLYLTNEGLYEVWCGSFSMMDTFEKKKRDYPVMQFTGLKDKNATEVCEGDIVTLGKESECKIVRYEVGGFKVGRIYLGLGIKDSELMEDVEIIGNIYENPELINSHT